MESRKLPVEFDEEIMITKDESFERIFMKNTQILVQLGNDMIKHKFEAYSTGNSVESLRLNKHFILILFHAGQVNFKFTKRI